jgi:hypothetical protein
MIKRGRSNATRSGLNDPVSSIALRRSNRNTVSKKAAASADLFNIEKAIIFHLDNCSAFNPGIKKAFILRICKIVGGNEFQASVPAVISEIKCFEAVGGTFVITEVQLINTSPSGTVSVTTPR